MIQLYSGKKKERVDTQQHTLMLYSGGMDTWNVNFPFSQYPSSGITVTVNSLRSSGLSKVTAHVLGVTSPSSPASV